MLDDLLPAGFHASQTRGDVAGVVLFGEERAAVEGAVAGRRAEFATGRHCARQALRRLGASPVPLPVGEDRAPVWPDRVLGSLTHCTGFRAAAVGWAGGEVLGIGIDAEPDRPLPAEVIEHVLRTDERLGTGAHDRLVFSAKEAVFKAWWPLERRWLDFHEARVTVEQGGVLAVDVLADRTVACRYEGRWGAAGGVLFTLVTAVRA